MREFLNGSFFNTSSWGGGAIVGKNERFHQALPDENDKDEHNLETLMSSHLLHGDIMQKSRVGLTELQGFFHLFIAVLIRLWER